MISKEELLSEISRHSKEGMLSKAEMLKAFSSGKNEDSAITREIGIPEILYFVGGIIVFIGISILIWQNWETLPTATRILVTFGTALSSYVAGLLMMRSKDLEGVGHAFQIISVLTMPLGVAVTLDAFSIDIWTELWMTIISSVLFAFYVSSYFATNRVIFQIFSIAYGTLTFFTVTNLMISGNPLSSDWHFTEYRIMAVGASYIFLGYNFLRSELEKLSGILFGLGAAFVLGSALILGGWSPNQNVFWELIFPGLAFGALFLSVPLKSKGFLAVGTLSLMVYIGKITGEYFSEGMGWPMALIFCGFLMIGIGYLAFYINQNYLKSKDSHSIT